jgi:hypothetical protein
MSKKASSELDHMVGMTDLWPAGSEDIFVEEVSGHFPAAFLRKRREFWSIEAEIAPYATALVKLPELTSAVRVDRLHFDPLWSQDLLVSLFVGKRSLSRVTASRFQRPGVGVRLGWSARVGERFEMVLINISSDKRSIVGSLDYTVLA